VEIEGIALAALRARIGDLHGDRRLSALAERVVGRELDPYSAADELVAGVSV
jgi:LAO/AO transport system kinase